MHTTATPPQLAALTVFHAGIVLLESDGRHMSAHTTPALAVWADLEPLRAAGVPLAAAGTPFATLVAHQTGIGIPDGEPTQILVDFGLSKGSTADGGSLLASPFRLVLPTSLMMLLSRLASDRGIPVLLLDGPAPAGAAMTVTQPDDAAVALIMDQGLLTNLLTTLSARFNSAAPSPDIDTQVREDLWRVLGGVALGQNYAWRGMSDIGVAVEHIMSGQHPDPGASTFVAHLIRAIEAYLTRSAGNDPGLRQGTSSSASVSLLPVPGDRELNESVDLFAVADLERNIPFRGVLDEYGARRAVTSAIAVIASRAVAAAAQGWSGEPAGLYTLTNVLTGWGGDLTIPPRWSLTANHRLLGLRDTALLNNFYALTPTWQRNEPTSGKWAAGFIRFLHVLTQALHTTQFPTGIADAVTALDVQPDDPNTVIDLANQLHNSPAGRQQTVCPACVVEQQHMQSGDDPNHLIATATALLACLGDINAATAGLVVGEPAWVEFRDHWYRNWLAQAAND